MNGQSPIYKMGTRKVRAKLKRVKMSKPRSTNCGNENHKGSMF